MEPPSEPPRNVVQKCPLSSSDAESARKWRRARPSGAPGIDFQAIPGPDQFKLRLLAAIVHVRQFKFRALLIW
eukprot:15439408-Alexandrium_andersonii.AAC.1